MDNVPSKSVRERLSQWDTKLALLEDYQKEGVMEISTLTNQRPFPEDVSDRTYNETSYKLYHCISQLPAEHSTHTVSTSSHTHIPQITNTEEVHVRVHIHNYVLLF